jgi:single-strand DNA-binding protein
MRGFNRVILAGNLTRDPEVRYTVNKKAYARFGLAINSTWRNPNGEVQENTDFVNLVAWGSTAEICGKYLKKGSPILIEGRIKSGSYDAKDGSGKRTSIDVYVDNMTMLGPRQGNSGGYSSGEASSPSFGGNMPDSASFGKSIGEEGFGAGSFTQDFANDNNSTPDVDDAGIPF